MKSLTWLICGTALVLLFARPMQSQVVKYQDCTVDAEIWLLPKCALVTKDGHLYVSPRYLKLFFAKSDKHLAARQLPEHGWSYFDRSGLVRVQDVAPMDNWASEFHAGLVRVVQNDKWGLADERGRMVTSLDYDGMYEFDAAHKGWEVCRSCRVVTRDEHSWFEGGEWFWLNQQGRLAGPTPDLHLLRPKSVGQ
jgi:hypothetical protein